MRALKHALTTLGTLTSRPTAFLIVIVYGALWPFFEPDTFDWHAIATLATWLMTLLIQRAEHRDTQAIHAKLDEILLGSSSTRSSISHIDEKEPEDVEAERERMRERRGD